MPFLTSLFEPKRRSIENPSTPLAAPDDWLYDALGAYRATSGVNVNRETALTYASFWRAVNLISRSVAKMPLHVMCWKDNRKEKDTDHPAYWLLRKKPNAEMTPFHFKQMMMMHVLAEGNAYAYIDRDRAGRPLELIPLQPNQTYPIRANGRIYYITQTPGGTPEVSHIRRLDPEDVLHFKGLSFDGLVGYSVIVKARESLGLGMAQDQYGSVFFRNGATPLVVIEHPGRLKPEAVKTLRESWERLHSGLENSHKTAILQDGMQAKPLSLTAKDAQLLESRQFSKSEIADWFCLPPSKLGLRESQSYNTLEQENQAYLDDAIDPWLVNIEQECDLKLLSDFQQRRNTHAVEFDRKALIRADMTGRVAYYHSGLSDGWLSRNEVRAEEGYDPIPDGTGEIFLQPLNMGATSGEGGKPGTGDEQPPADTQALPPGAGLLEVPDIRQPDHFSCGACSAMAVGRYFGVGPESLQEWKDALGTDVEQSTHPFAIARYLSSLGLAVTAKHGMTLDDLKRCWQAGQPVICCVQDYSGEIPDGAEFDYGHYLTVIGTALGYVFCQDSSIENLEREPGGDVTPADSEVSGNISAPGRIMIQEATWLENWHDQDADGNRYVQFGIAVGREMLPPLPGQKPEDLEQPNEEAEGKVGEKVAPLNQPELATGPDGDLQEQHTLGRAKLVEIQYQLLTDACRRIAKKVGTQARRQSKDGRRFMTWLDAFPAEHRDVAEAAIAPCLAALKVLGEKTEHGATDFLAAIRSDLLDLSGKVTAKQLAGAVDRRMARWESGKLRCGGEGGKPGPCPEGGGDTGGDNGGDKKAAEKEKPAKNADVKQHLESSVKEMEDSPEGRADLEKGKSLAQKVGGAIKEGAKAALNALDAESMGGVSLLAHGISAKDPKSVAAGAAHLFNSVFKCVHEEVFEQLLSDSTHGPAIVAKLAAKVAAHGVVLANHGAYKAAVWAMGKLTGGKRSMLLTQRRSEEDTSLRDADAKLLDGLTQTAARAIRDTLAEIGVTLDDGDIDMGSLKELLLKVLEEDKASQPDEEEEETPAEEPTEEESKGEEGDEEQPTNQGEE